MGKKVPRGRLGGKVVVKEVRQAVRGDEEGEVMSFMDGGLVCF